VSRTEHIEVERINCVDIQLLLRSKTHYYSRGSIIADSRETAKGLIVITSGQVLVLKVLLGIVKRITTFCLHNPLCHVWLSQCLSHHVQHQRADPYKDILPHHMY
jgi:hypothetical protein